MTDTKTPRRWVENGQAITRARKRKGISQERLAEQIGTTRRHMIRLENGEHLPGTILRDRIVAACDVEQGAIRSADDGNDSEEDPLAGVTVEDLVRTLLSRCSA